VQGKGKRKKWRGRKGEKEEDIWLPASAPRSASDTEITVTVSVDCKHIRSNY